MTGLATQVDARLASTLRAFALLMLEDPASAEIHARKDRVAAGDRVSAPIARQAICSMRTGCRYTIPVAAANIPITGPANS